MTDITTPGLHVTLCAQKVHHPSLMGVLCTSAAARVLLLFGLAHSNEYKNYNAQHVELVPPVAASCSSHVTRGNSHWLPVTSPGVWYSLNHNKNPKPQTRTPTSTSFRVSFSSSRSLSFLGSTVIPPLAPPLKFSTTHDLVQHTISRCQVHIEAHTQH